MRMTFSVFGHAIIRSILRKSRVPFVAAILACLSLQVANVAYAADFPTFERVLLPVIANEPIDGDHGTRWQTTVTLTNASATPHPVLFFLAPAMVFSLPQLPTQIVQPNFTYSPQIFLVPGSHAALIYIERTYVDDFQVELRVRDVSQTDSHWGTALPVVRDRNFRDATLTLSDIPVSPNFRSRLRVYGVDLVAPVNVRIALWGIPNRDADSVSSDEFLGEVDSSLLPPELPQVGISNPFSPSTLEVANVERILPVKGYTRLRVDITPRVPGTRIWAFATVTSNQTQQISVIEPYR